MSQDQHSPIDNENDQSGFYNDRKSEQSDQNREKNDIDNIPSKSDLYKSHKTKHIKKKQRGHPKQKTTKQEQREKKKMEQAHIQAEAIIDQMQKRYDQDKKLYQKKKPANKKLTYLSTLSQKLKNIAVWDKFLQLNGLEQFDLWFTKLPQGIEPSLTLRKGLLQILDNLRIRSEYLNKTNEIQRVVQKHKKSQTKQLRQLSESILLKWSKTLHEQDIE